MVSMSVPSRSKRIALQSVMPLESPFKIVLVVVLGLVLGCTFPSWTMKKPQEVVGYGPLKPP